jgi:serine phosphatase RsbU (regulator of sigma subunit)
MEAGLRLEESVRAMRSGTLLDGRDGEILTGLLEQAEMVGLEDGEVLFRQGETGDCAYLVVAGAVDVMVETPLGEVVMTTLGPQQVVGEIAVFSDLMRTATVRAKDETLLLRIERRQLADTIARHPETAFGLIAAMGRRIHALNQPLALLTLAGQALEQDEGDNGLMARIADQATDIGPFGRSFKKIVHEMEEKHARRQELAVASRIQQSILPRPLTLGPDWDLAAFMHPARSVGGDFYDWFTTQDGRMILIVADVSGKGVPAALFMAVSRTLIRAAMMGGAGIEAALSAANAQLDAENDESMFVTVFLAELDLVTGMVRYINAGHCEGWLRRAGGALEPLAATGPALALIPNAVFRADSVVLGPGDLLFLSSDGISEAFSQAGALFGDERLRRVLSDHRPDNAQAAVAAVAGAVTDFAAHAEQSDDITCLALLRRSGHGV